MKITFELSDKRIADLLCSGFEGGIGYWARIDGYTPPSEIVNPWKDETICSEGWNPPRYITYPFSPRGAVHIRDMEEDKVYSLTHEDLQKGMAIMQAKFPRHFGQFMAQNDDAETGDVFLQCCLFGDIIYG